MLGYIAFALGTTIFTISFFAIVVTVFAFARYRK